MEQRKPVTSYRKVADQTYEASDGTHVITVAYGWLRAGGWQWIVQDRRLNRQWVTGPTRKAAAEAALRSLARTA